jgi:hypothetical protein
MPGWLILCRYAPAELAAIFRRNLPAAIFRSLFSGCYFTDCYFAGCDPALLSVLTIHRPPINLESEILHNLESDI